MTKRRQGKLPRFMLATSIAAATILTTASQTSAASPYVASGVGALIRETQTIRYRDADLHTATGAKAVALRIRNAADFVCGDNPMRRQESDFLPCREAAVDRALATLGAPMVAAALGRTSGSGLAQR